jgi:integrase
MRVPKYRPRKDRDSAYVEMDGRRLGLPGRFNSPESKEAYRRLLNEYLRTHATKAKTKPIRPTWEITVAELVAAWLDHCKTYYACANTRSNEYSNCRYAARPLVALRGDTAVVDFGAADLKAVRDAMITGSWTSDKAKRPIKPWPRRHANAQVNRIKRMFRWGLEEGMVPPEVSAIAGAVAPLAKGRTIAAETDDVPPVEDRIVDATLPHLPAVVRAMVEIQRATGMRSDNLCALRPCDVDRTGPIWLYIPPAHKGTTREKLLVVPLGPRCQAALRPYLHRQAEAFCFSPREVVGRAVGRRAPGTRYTTGSYRRAVERACELAFGMPAELRLVPRKLPPEERRRLLDLAAQWRQKYCWNPHQLRHSAVQRAKQARGLDGARAYVGHSAVKTTQIYEQRDLDLACEIARAIG